MKTVILKPAATKTKHSSPLYKLYIRINVVRMWVVMFLWFFYEGVDSACTKKLHKSHSDSWALADSRWNSNLVDGSSRQQYNVM